MLQLPAWLTTRPRRLVAEQSGTDPDVGLAGADARTRAETGGGSDAGIADNAHRPVIDLVRPHLQSGDCLIVTGYQDFLSSLAILMREVPALGLRLTAPPDAAPDPAVRMRIAFGVDTAGSGDFGGRGRTAPETLRRHFLERQGLQVEDAADLQAVLAIGAIERGDVALRLFDEGRAREVFGLSSTRRLHAKIVTSPLGAVAGSANFSRAGLWRNIEYTDDLRLGAARDTKHLAQARINLAERIWDASSDWTAEALEILRTLLRPVTAEDAVCRLLAEQQLTRIPGKSDLAKAFRYALNRWSSFTLFLEDGRLAIDNNVAERAMRPIGVGRKNWLFAGSDTGGETLARAMTLIESAKMNGLDPQAYLADVLDRIHDHMSNRLDELLPWNWTPKAQIMPENAAA